MATAQRTRRKKTTTPKTTKSPSENEAVQSENQTKEIEQLETVKKEQKVQVDSQLRAQQWEMLSPRDRDRLNMTRDEFLKTEDVTGFGFNSYFTPLEERRVGQTPSAPRDTGN